jgi:riboflavin kinase/FMN adenylyltransferase
LVVIGNFDGFHRGHQALLAAAAREAMAEGLGPRVLTFTPHPAKVLGRTPPPVLTRPERKRELVRRAFPTVEVVEQTFDLGFAALSPDQFAEWLAREQGAARVLVGQNFRFGKGRAGGFDDLVRLGAVHGFRAAFEPLVGDDGGAWSSTRIRNAIATGDLPAAERMLGRPHLLIGEVGRGKQLGRTIGMPTANLEAVEEMLPPFGVYATLVDIVEAGRPRALGLGAMSIGVNPTTDTTTHVKAEVNVLDFDGDLYGRTLRVSLVARIRGEERFDSLDALVAQMRVDVASCRDALAGRKPDPSTGSFG